MVVVILFTSTIGGVYAQLLTPPANSDLAPTIKLLREYRINEAIKALKWKILKNKKDAEAWYYLGVVYLQIGDSKEATSAFQRAIKLKPDFAAGAHAEYAYALVCRNRLKEAREEAQKALSVEPNNIDALYTMGLISLRTGERDEAIKYADALLAVKPDVAEAYLMKSQAYMPFNGEAIVTRPGELKDHRLVRYRAVFAVLEQYLKLEMDLKEAQIWHEQLENLKFYMTDESDPASRVYRGSEVTTRTRLLNKPEPLYPQRARQAHIIGRVVLRCVVSADGAVKHILVVESLPHGLTDAAVAAAKQIKFVPATLNGQAVSMFMQLEYNFNLY
jgi:TonB family protein